MASKRKTQKKQIQRKKSQKGKNRKTNRKVTFRNKTKGGYIFNRKYKFIAKNIREEDVKYLRNFDKVEEIIEQSESELKTNREEKCDKQYQDKATTKYKNLVEGLVDDILHSFFNYNFNINNRTWISESDKDDWESLKQNRDILRYEIQKEDGMPTSRTERIKIPRYIWKVIDKNGKYFYIRPPGVGFKAETIYLCVNDNTNIEINIKRSLL